MTRALNPIYTEGGCTGKVEKMFGIGMPELIVIAVIALLVVGPKRLPDLAKSFGKGLSEFRKATEGATETLKETLHMDEIKQDVDIKESFLHHPSSPVTEGGKETPPPNAAS
ncbi:MAG: Sec-independent protein translocase protein TatB [Syntrophales bacterium]|nr:Sec-independent protein translocase protein TatB [Syntrophales bacterium]